MGCGGGGVVVVAPVVCCEVRLTLNSLTSQYSENIGWAHALPPFPIPLVPHILAPGFVCGYGCFSGGTGEAEDPDAPCPMVEDDHEGPLRQNDHVTYNSRCKNCWVSAVVEAVRSDDGAVLRSLALEGATWGMETGLSGILARQERHNRNCWP